MLRLLEIPSLPKSNPPRKNEKDFIWDATTEEIENTVVTEEDDTEDDAEDDSDNTEDDSDNSEINIENSQNDLTRVRF